MNRFYRAACYVWIATALGACGIEAPPSSKPAAQTTTPGPFTVAQVEAGRGAYAANCAGCHGKSLEGGFSGSRSIDALAGKGFLSSWSYTTSGHFYEYIHDTMPRGREKSLSSSTYSAIVAFIFAFNGAKPGSQSYAADTDVPISAFLHPTDPGDAYPQPVP